MGEQKKKIGVITESVKVRDLKISDPGWDSCVIFSS